MATTKGSGNVWFAVSNIFGAILFAVLGLFAGTLAVMVGSIALYVIGIATIIVGLSHLSETSLIGVAVEIILGVIIIIAGKWLTAFGFGIIAYILSGAFIAYVGFKQFGRRKKRYAEDTNLETPVKAIATVMGLAIFLSGILLIVSSIMDYIHPVSWLGSIASGLCILGSVLWIVHTVLTLSALNKRGLGVNNFNGKRKRGNGGGRSSNRSSSGSSGSSRGAGESKVRSEMNSIASYYTGGWDYIGSKAQVKYAVAVSVGNGNVEFTVTCTVTGQVLQSEADSARSKLLSLAEKKQKTVLDRAMNKLNGLNPDREYSVSVNVVKR